MLVAESFICSMDVFADAFYPPTAVFGPAATTWFSFLARRINFPDRPNLTIAARVLPDQAFFASTNLFCFLSSMAIMEGSDPKEKLDSTYWEALKKNYMLWPIVQTLNFKFVPVQGQVLVVNIVSLGKWTLASYRKHVYGFNSQD